MMVHVYVMTDEGNKQFFVGVTNDIIRKIAQHKSRVSEEWGTDSQYTANKLVYYMAFENEIEAKNRAREIRFLNEFQRAKLIYSHNPEYKDLYKKVCGQED